MIPVIAGTSGANGAHGILWRISAASPPIRSWYAQEAVSLILIADLGRITNAIAMAMEERDATQAITRAAQSAASGEKAISQDLTILARAAADTGHAAGASHGASGHPSADSAKMTSQLRRFPRNSQAA